MSLRAFKSLRLLAALLLAGAACAGPAVARLDDTFPPVITITFPAEGQVIASNQGALPIKVGDDVIGAAGASGAPGGEKDEACIKAGLDKVADQLK